MIIMSQRQRDVFCPEADEIMRLIGHDRVKLREYLKATLEDYKQFKDIDSLFDALYVIVEALEK